MINTQLSYEAAAHSSYSQFTSNIMASSPVVTTGGSVVVVTHVIPAPQVAAAQNTARKNKLRRGHVVALGSVLSGSLTVAAEEFNNCAIRTTAVSGVLAGVSVLEFIISICVFVFVYDASRQSMDQQPTVITNQSHEAATQTLTLPTYEPPPVSQPPTTIPERSYETTRPLEYDMSIPTPPPDPASFVAFKLF
ncbi:uncharacterized protein LOC125892629 isoform X12 [Epinephelus fuscoguttatus]|uniref:uncharacterized protein LOC125892629 isoform X12 n=1 Tax=Epinephelus fuscoguttatus TaxID=293821 RepID=UPI0020D05C54|nr:uncharacterized protein LOC125892629 isoform X12 [Epinephelus fuscoguttatus]